jgi:hypothetical protein
MEIEREKRVISMMITMHSILKERYLRLSSLFENTLLVASVVLTAIVFVDHPFISKITGLSEDNLKFIIGVSVIIVFAISVVMIQVKWKEKAEEHATAAEHLFILHQQCRKIMTLKEGLEKNEASQEFSVKYVQVLNLISKIPDSKFNSLKLKHYRKVELSKMIDKNPGSLLIILKLKLLLSSFKSKS